MNSDLEILDDQDSPNQGNHESRFAQVVRIVVGILFILFGVVLLVAIAYDFYRFSKLVTSPYYLNFYGWDDWLLNKSLSFLYMITFLVGGIGLLRKSRMGWVFSLTISIFVVLQIGYMIYWISQSYFVRDLGVFGWIMVGVMLFFALIAFFLLSKPIRSFFQPTPKSFLIAGIIFAAFTTDFIIIRVFIG